MQIMPSHWKSQQSPSKHSTAHEPSPTSKESPTTLTPRGHLQQPRRGGHLHHSHLTRKQRSHPTTPLPLPRNRRKEKEKGLLGRWKDTRKSPECHSWRNPPVAHHQPQGSQPPADFTSLANGSVFPSPHDGVYWHGDVEAPYDGRFGCFLWECVTHDPRLCSCEFRLLAWMLNELTRCSHMMMEHSP